MTSIGAYAFYECTNLEQVVFYDSVKRIGDHAFSECLALKNITFYKTSGSFDDVVKGAYWDTNAGAYTSAGAYSVSETTDSILINYGDANGDGSINAKDLLKIKKYLSAYDYDTGTSSVDIYPGGDCTGDGFINAKDLIRLKNYLSSYDYDTGRSDVVLGPQ